MKFCVLISLVLVLVYPSNVFSREAPTKTVEHRLYRVAWVIDGDTIKLENGQHVRLLGIDAPETRDGPKLRKDLRRLQITKDVELAKGKKSHHFVKNLLEGKKVSIKFDEVKYDRYRRVLAYVYLPDGRFVNAEIIKAGYAYYYDDHRKVNTKYLATFKELYKQARENHRGLWQNGGVHEKHFQWFSNN